MIDPTQVGPKVQAIHKHRAELPKQVRGQHLWVVTSLYKVTPKPLGEYFLDMENLLTIDGPGCFWCEEMWSEHINNKPCRGHGQ
jgi:hypothetical protein